MTLFAWQRFQKKREQVLYNCSEFDRKNDEWVPFPIGMSWQIVNYQDSLDTAFMGTHENLVFCAISDHTDQRRRGSQPINRRSILATLAKNGIQNVHADSDSYFHLLPTYKFVISPEGNGIDCHRHYEALMAGCIPIVEDYPNMREKYGNCPILYTKDYSEITPSYLATKYIEMVGQVWDFSNLCMDTFDRATQRQIQLNGNYWGGQIARKPWYLSILPEEKKDANV